MHYCSITTKNISGLKKKTKEMNFQIHKFLPFLVHPTMHLPSSPYYMDPHATFCMVK